MENRDIQVTIAGSNFDLLESLKVQITDGSTSQTPIDAEIKVNLNTATATNNPIYVGINRTIVKKPSSAPFLKE